jgi:hypothetical protein
METEWNPNLWETPTDIAKAIAGLLTHDEGKILEPAVGSGQIAFELCTYANVVSLIGVEVLEQRADLAKKRLPSKLCKVLNQDFLAMPCKKGFDVVVTNPPFDKGMDFIEHSLGFLSISGRLLFLLPIAYFQSQERARQFAGMNAYIHRVYPVVGRIAYLKNGVPESGRQCEDAIFDIRAGKLKGQVEFIWQ